MEYHGLRRAGDDIDLIVCERDDRALAASMPQARATRHGSPYTVVGPFEMWRDYRQLDYAYFLEGAIEAGPVVVASLDRLLLMLVCRMDAEKARDDMRLIESHVRARYANGAYIREALGRDAGAR